VNNIAELKAYISAKFWTSEQVAAWVRNNFVQRSQVRLDNYTLVLTSNSSLGATIGGGGTIATGGFTFTVPATGTAALLGVTQTFSGVKTFGGGETKFDAGAGALSYLRFLQNAVSKVIIGISNGAGALIAGTVSGDLAIRTNSQKILFSNDDGTTAHLELSGASQPLLRLNSVAGNSAVNRWAIGGTNKALIGVSGTAGGLVPGDAAGDLGVRVVSGQKMLFSTDDGSTKHMELSAGNLWVHSNMSALSITDRTPGYEGDALKELAGIRSKNGEIDHSTLPAFARKDVGGEGGRDLGAMISMLTVAVQQLTARVSELEGKK
jgi:hypothetical protein